MISIEEYEELLEENQELQSRLIKHKYFHSKFKKELYKDKTDLDKFIELYKSFGIRCVVEEGSDYNVINLTADEYDEIWSDINSYSNKFTGMLGIITSIYFTKEGKFIEQSFWR